MSVFAIGIDVTEISRMKKIIERYGEKFTRRIFTDREIAYCSRQINYASYAARFAAKEAVFKATGLGLREKITWKDVEVINNELGKPELRLAGETARIFRGHTLYVSLSHSKEIAIAMVVVE